MVTYDEHDGSGAVRRIASWHPLLRGLSAGDHKTIGILYLAVALAAVIGGMALSLPLRLPAIWSGASVAVLPGSIEIASSRGTLALLHGSLMVFWVLTAAPQLGFGHYFLPMQIGAREMAFPALSRLSLGVALCSLGGMVGSFFTEPQRGLALWIASAALFCIAALLAALNFSVTVIDLRAPGMTLPRLPMTVWAWLVNALLSLLIFSILLAASVFLLAQRWLGAQLFASPLAPGVAGAESWQHIFWFFAQAEVYVAMLPCFGIVSHLLATFARRPVWAPRMAVLALCGVGVFGFCVWGFHMFSSGMNPGEPLVFSSLAMSLAVPSLLLVVSWLGTLWRAKVRMTVPLLFACGSVSLFLAGGLSGLFLERRDLAAAAVDDRFVAGHFHLVMGAASAFAILGAFFFWYPKMTARRLHAGLGRAHFWATFAGVYCTFMPMHWLGLFDHSRSVFDGRLAAAAVGFVSAAIVVTTAAQFLFFANVASSLFRHRLPGAASAGANPWDATTLEWTVASPPPAGNFGSVAPAVYRTAYDFSEKDGADFSPQSLPLKAQLALQPAPMRSVQQVPGNSQ